MKRIFSMFVALLMVLSCATALSEVVTIDLGDATEEELMKAQAKISDRLHELRSAEVSHWEDFSLGEFSYKAPPNWLNSEDASTGLSSRSHFGKKMNYIDGGLIFASTTATGASMLKGIFADTSDEEKKKTIESFFNYLFESMGLTFDGINKELVSISDHKGVRFRFDMNLSSGRSYSSDAIILLGNENILFLRAHHDTLEEQLLLFESIIDSITVPKGITMAEAEKQKEGELTKLAESHQVALARSLTITKISTSKPNSAGGVTLSISWSNNSEKEIKYITFYAIAINGVDEEVDCDITGYSGAEMELTGPFKQGKKNNSTSKNAWYNKTIKNARLDEVSIEYMDGTYETIDGKYFDYNWISK